MRLYLIRHGIAQNNIPESGLDSDRSLTEEGVSQLKELSTKLPRIIPDLDLLLISPYLRTRQTAELYFKNINVKSIEQWDCLRPNEDPMKFLSKLVSAKEPNIAVVGHEPHIHSSLSLLLTGNEKMSLRIEKASVHCVDCYFHEASGSYSSELVYSITPQILSSI